MFYFHLNLEVVLVMLLSKSNKQLINKNFSESCFKTQKITFNKKTVVNFFFTNNFSSNFTLSILGIRWLGCLHTISLSFSHRRRNTRSGSSFTWPQGLLKLVFVIVNQHLVLDVWHIIFLEKENRSCSSSNENDQCNYKQNNTND